MPRPGPDHPPAAAITVAELEAAVAALPGKRDALRETFDHLAACSPAPLPFTWEDLDAHLSSLQSSIALRFRQVRALEAARPAPDAAAPAETRAGETAVNVEEEEELVEVEVEEEEEVLEVEEEVVVVEVEEEMVVEEEEEVVEQEVEEKADEEMQEGDKEETDNKIGKDGKDEKEARDEVEEAAVDKIGDVKGAREEEQDADEEMHVANEEEQSRKGAEKPLRIGRRMSTWSTEDAKKASHGEEEQDINKEDANMEDAKNASAVQGKEQEACFGKQVEEEQEAHKEEQDSKHTTEEEMANVSRDQDSLIRPGPGGLLNDLAAACTSMDAPRLVKFMHTKVGLSPQFRAPMRRAPDAAALSLCVIELFLHDKMFKSNKVWNNCIGMIRTVPVVVTKLSTESIEHAKRLAKVWKEMLDNPGSCMALGSLASWGLLNFLISYNIVSTFDMKEIFCIFGTIPHKQQRKNHHALFNDLGLTDRIPELMDYLIGNGQHINVLYLVPFFNLVDKYPPFSLLRGYIEKAKQTAVEISQNNMTHQSLNAVIIKELDNLRIARDLAKQQVTDYGLRSGIMAEISALLDEFGKKKQSVANASIALTSNPHQKQAESKKKRKKKQGHHKGQEYHQQGKKRKLGEKLDNKQNKPQQEQQQK